MGQTGQSPAMQRTLNLEPPRNANCHRLETATDCKLPQTGNCHRLESSGSEFQARRGATTLDASILETVRQNKKRTALSTNSLTELNAECEQQKANIARKLCSFSGESAVEEGRLNDLTCRNIFRDRAAVFSIDRQQWV
jgi:hypothetical protein